MNGNTMSKVSTSEAKWESICISVMIDMPLSKNNVLDSFLCVFLVFLINF